MNLIASNRPFPDREVETPEELASYLDSHKPDYIFFPFWSWIVPPDIVDRYACIGFHTGCIRGGSPIQNLIRKGVENAHIRMFRMNNSLDGGGDIMTCPINLNGSLEEIIIRQTEQMEKMIDVYMQTNHG
jgi:methionyl-tRNA formyltransferase